MSEICKVLSPWSEVDTSIITGLNPRLDTLEGKTIGMFGDFMIAATYMLRAVEQEIHKRYPTAKFSYMMYKTETVEIPKDPEFKPEFDEWISGVDCVLSFYGAVPSSSLFLGYNSAYMEKCGKPTVMLVTPRTSSAGKRGVKAKGVPDLRIVEQPLVVDIFGHASEEATIAAMQPFVAGLTDQLVGALTDPLTAEEANPTIPAQEYARTIYSGTPDEINDLFYRNGWTNGQPVRMPTREAVDEMMRGTDLPADYVVGYIPPKMGAATVERIAVNAVMAGCLPTYLPVLIAAVKGALAPEILLEGWTCSQSTWGPVLTLSGKIVKDIGLNVADNFLSPYYKPNAAIARAFGYIMMNIGGLRPGIEDLSEMGHENRMGFVMGDNADANPWKPLQTDFGYGEDDSCVTMFWPQEHRVMTTGTVEGILSFLCTINPYGWDPGMCIIMSPIAAKIMADAGWTKDRIKKYVVEYARHPGSEVDIAWLVGNSHPPKSVDIPVNMGHSTRIFWTDEHMFLIVGGGRAGSMITVFAGGGDHGGPSCTKIDLPKNWDALVAEYSDCKPHYIDY